MGKRMRRRPAIQLDLFRVVPFGPGSDFQFSDPDKPPSPIVAKLEELMARDRHRTVVLRHGADVGAALDEVNQPRREHVLARIPAAPAPSRRSRP